MQHAHQITHGITVTLIIGLQRREQVEQRGGRGIAGAVTLSHGGAATHAAQHILRNAAHDIIVTFRLGRQHTVTDVQQLLLTVLQEGGCDADHLFQSLLADQFVTQQISRNSTIGIAIATDFQKADLLFIRCLISILSQLSPVSLAALGIQTNSAEHPAVLQNADVFTITHVARDGLQEVANRAVRVEIFCRHIMAAVGEVYANFFNVGIQEILLFSVDNHSDAFNGGFHQGKGTVRQTAICQAFNDRHMLVQHKEDNEKVQVDTNTESDKGLSIVQCTYSELKQKGLTARTISKQLIANDAALYGSDILGANAGTIEQWAAQIEAAPDNWFFFCEGTRIIGNWSITFLAPEEEVSVRKGTFAGDDFSLKSVNYPLTASDKEVVIYILNISLNSGYQTHDNWKALWNSFGKRVRQLNATGITVKGIYSALFLDDHKVMFENMGFQCLVDNIVSGQVYYLDLSNPNLANFSWIIPNDEAVGLNLPISFKQLSHNDILDEQQLRDIAGLIYDTDKYIYPMMFSSREQAKELLPMLFASNEDNMFNLNNIYCGMVGKRIVSLILHIRGPLVWKSDQLTELANLLDMKLPKTVDLVEKNYFTGYASTASNTTAILNCCVNSNYRMRNEIRLGTRMMQSFIEHHPERLELYVLQETNAAMRLYLRTGFKPLRKCNGFSADNRELPCYFMYKPAK